MADKEYDQKKRECWEEYLSKYKTTYTRTAFDFAFDRAYTLGKQERDAEETVIQGWVARDEDGFISIYQNNPIRDGYDCNSFWHDCDSGSHIELPITSFPDLTWDSEPQEVEIIIKRKKNG